jgi:ABC-type lipoprotein release transport system permease subunit
MNAKLLMIISFLFFLSWKKAADSFLLFCSLFAVGLCVCVLIYGMESTRITEDGDNG